jgi:coenzyme F420-reducing hydrogenase delta subunit
LRRWLVNSNFEPRIFAYACIYCAFAAADLAGSMRLQYPPNVKIVKLPCTGKLDILHVLKAFESGADGVFVAGCLEGNCHFLKGNLRAKKRVEYAKMLLKDAGLEPERLEMFNMSSAMGVKFADVARTFTDRIRALGPSPMPAALHTSAGAVCPPELMEAATEEDLRTAASKAAVGHDQVPGEEVRNPS